MSFELAGLILTHQRCAWCDTLFSRSLGTVSGNRLLCKVCLNRLAIYSEAFLGCCTLHQLNGHLIWTPGGSWRDPHSCYQQAPGHFQSGSDLECLFLLNDAVVLRRSSLITMQRSVLALARACLLVFVCSSTPHAGITCELCVCR